MTNVQRMVGYECWFEFPQWPLFCVKSFLCSDRDNDRGRESVNYKAISLAFMRSSRREDRNLASLFLKMFSSV